MMPDLSLETMRLAYALGGLLTAAWVATFGVRRLWPWLADNRPESLEDWVLAPIVGFVIVMMALSLTVAAWPIALIVLRRERRRLAAQERQRLLAEEEALLDEMRKARG